jgi:hypothetical protein
METADSPVYAPPMIVIYVQKSWLDTIGDTADLLLTLAEKNDCVSILAMEQKLDSDSTFVHARLTRKDAGEGDAWFIPSSIPTRLVEGIFNMTRKETKRFGFSGPSKK